MKQLLDIGPLQVGIMCCLFYESIVLALTLPHTCYSPHTPHPGKKLFEPDGSLPRPIIKRLARNAGSIRAPSVTYDTKYEVGETNVCHQWRKRTLLSTTYEELLLSLRVLDAHMDKAVSYLLYAFFPSFLSFSLFD